MRSRDYDAPHCGRSVTVVENRNILERLSPFWDHPRSIGICFIQVSRNMIRVCDACLCIGVVYRGDCVIRLSIRFCRRGRDPQLLQLSLDIRIFDPFRLEWNAFVAQGVSWR